LVFLLRGKYRPIFENKGDFYLRRRNARKMEAISYYMVNDLQAFCS
jgi:hypothetical protein